MIAMDDCRRQAADSRIVDWRTSILLAAVIATGCASGAPLPPPAPQVPPAFRESADWKAGQPADELKRGAWWEIFGDPQLNAPGDPTRLSVEVDTGGRVVAAKCT